MFFFFCAIQLYVHVTLVLQDCFIKPFCRVVRSWTTGCCMDPNRIPVTTSDRYLHAFAWHMSPYSVTYRECC